MARTKIAEFAKRAVEEEDDVGVPLSPAGTEAGKYERRWFRLISTMRVGLTLHEELVEIVEAHRKAKQSDELPATNPLARIAQIKARVEALAERYSGIIGRFLVWREELREHLRANQAHLSGIPVLSAVDEVSAAFSRAYNQLARIPVEPTLDPNSTAALEARVKYLNDMKDLVARAERFPGEIGRAIQALNETMARHAHQLEEAKFKGDRDNTSAYRLRPPRHPLVGAPAPAPRAVRQPDPYAFLVQ